MRTILRWTTGANLGLGLWVLAAPFALEAQAAGRWNNVLVGTAIVIVAGYNYAHERTRRTVRKRRAGLNCALGAWLLVVPFVVGVTGPLRWSDVAVGVLLLSLSGYNVYVVALVQRTRARSGSEAHRDRGQKRGAEESNRLGD